MRCKRIEVYPAEGTKIFIIIEVRGKIIYHSLTSIIDVAPSCASNSFLIFHGNKSKSDFSSNAVNRATCNYSRSRMLHIVQRLLHNTRIEHCIIIRRYEYEFTYILIYIWIFRSFARLTSCCASESTLWISIPSMIRNSTLMCQLTRSYFFA